MQILVNEQKIKFKQCENKRQQMKTLEIWHFYCGLFINRVSTTLLAMLIAPFFSSSLRMNANGNPENVTYSIPRSLRLFDWQLTICQRAFFVLISN